MAPSLPAFSSPWIATSRSNRSNNVQKCKTSLSLRLPGDLNGTQRRALRSEAGRRASMGTLASMTLATGIDSESAARTVDEALQQDDLLRVRTSVRKRKEAAALGKDIAALTSAHLAQVIGHTFLLYRANKESRFKLPDAGEIRE